MERHLAQREVDEESSSAESPLVSLLHKSHLNVGIKTYLPGGTFCVMSKAIFVIYIWSVLVGSVHFIAINGALSVLIDLVRLMKVDASLPFVVVFSYVAILLIFYPVNGSLADICIGRYKMIIVSLGIISCSLIAALFALVFEEFLHGHGVHTVVYIMSGFGLLVAILGIAGYSANFIQFGLDQLLEAPSQHQAIFVHWAKWCYDLLSAVCLGLYVVHECDLDLRSTSQRPIVFSIFVFIVCVFSFTLAFTFWKRRWFRTEPGYQNPYKVVIKVLIFAWKHKYPLQRSAFTYCDDERPSRIDFAKVRFGGPFSTEQVEDVKTLLRIVAVLLSIGPIFCMDLMTSNAVLVYTGLHIGFVELEYQCGWEWAVLYSGALQYVMSAVFLPVYIWVIFKLLWKRVPKIVVRVGVGIVLYILGTICMLAVDLGGHIWKKGTNCFFDVHYENNSLIIPSLDMHWSSLLPSDIFLGIGSTLVIVSVFEFISAQSPHSMKGLLFGIFFGIRGIFQSISSIALFLFTSQMIWGNHNPSPVSCLSGYFIFTIVVAMFGLILFTILAKRYKCRQRDDRPYDQCFVVDYYSRMIENRRHLSTY